MKAKKQSVLVKEVDSAWWEEIKHYFKRRGMELKGDNGFFRYVFHKHMMENSEDYRKEAGK